MEITNKKFWLKFWEKVKLPQTVDYSFKNDRVIAETIKEYVPKAKYDKYSAEIGCAPGKWLIFCYREMKYKIHGYEYLEAAVIKTKENIIINRIPDDDYEIHNVNFINSKIRTRYNLVLSLGFIEHFKDYNKIFKRHVDILVKDGYLVIGLPNFRGFGYLIQRIIDRYGSDKILDNHNLNIMDLKEITKCSEENNMDIVFLDYIGGFEPALFDTSKISNKYIRKFIKVLILILGKIYNNYNNKFVSSYIIGVFKK